MAPTIPSSLSPHICILPSPDLSELLEHSALPPLQHILQSFSPLPQVTTRTTSLVSVPHSSFALRFSDLHEVEEACREPEEQRAARSLDWMTSRISKRCGKWVDDMQQRGEQELSRVPDEDRLRTPWWDELRRCAEGDFVPDRVEGWNHPVSVILAVSTTVPNPLQAIAALHSRTLQFPPWVDTNVLRYILIVHPRNSDFSDEEATALFNAVKKQYGLHSYLLTLSLPSPPPPPIPVPTLMPRLPPPSGLDSPEIHRHSLPTPTSPLSPHGQNTNHTPNTLRMQEQDVHDTARFTREFVVMSLIPWMERCVVEWNESYSSTRRLPSRLFSSTRRLFGSPSPSPAPGHSSSASIASLPARSMSLSNTNGVPAPPSAHRRLAEFATILGDFKLAASVWESLRKDSKGGSDMLPLLSAPSPALQLHASNALLAIQAPGEELHPRAQVQSLLFAARWEAGIDPRDFLSDALEGERWLVWAAGNAEEAPAALLFSHAALLSSMRKRSYRRAAFWYVTAAKRLEKCGVKPLTIYFLRKAHELFQVSPSKELSPSFWDSENKSQSATQEFVDIRSGVEYPLARLLYTTGDVTAAVRMFLDLLRGSPYPTLQPPTLSNLLELQDPGAFPSEDKLFLDDFRVAFAHLQANEPERIATLGLRMPITFCQPKQCKIRYPGETPLTSLRAWESREEEWKNFQRSLGNKTSLVINKQVCANEPFWVDVVLSNPLAAEVNLANLTLVVEQTGQQDVEANSLNIEVIQDVILRAKETRVIPVSLTCNRPMSIQVSGVKFNFLSLLPVTESLGVKGRRLHDTQAQRITPTYAPDVLLRADIAPASNKLTATFVDDGELVLKEGEIKESRIWVMNTGLNALEEVWVVTGSDQEVWLGEEQDEKTTPSDTEIVHSTNSLRPNKPWKLPLNEPLQPNQGTMVPTWLHGGRAGSHELLFFLAYREGESAPFHSARLGRSFEVQPLFDVAISINPSRSRKHSSVMNVEATSVSQSVPVRITQISTLSPTWKFCPISCEEVDLTPSQCGRFSFAAEPWVDGAGRMKESLAFVEKKLDDVLQGNLVTLSDPPEIDLVCSHLLSTPSGQTKSLHSTSLKSLLHTGRQKHASELAFQQHPHVPAEGHPHIFPLYNPLSVDLVVFWEISSQNRTGFVTVYGTRIGAGHAALSGIIDKAENSKVKRSMYAETVREKKELLEAIRDCEWNVEMDPTSVSVEDVTGVEHDFTKGPCHVPLNFLVRNHSPLYDTRVTLRLHTSARNSTSESSPSFPTPYSGKLTFRTTISPSKHALITTRLLVARPGLHQLGGWSVESEVLVDEDISAAENGGSGEARKRTFRYLQEHPPSRDACVMVRESPGFGASLN